MFALPNYTGEYADLPFYKFPENQSSKFNLQEHEGNKYDFIESEPRGKLNLINGFISCPSFPVSSNERLPKHELDVSIGSVSPKNLQIDCYCIFNGVRSEFVTTKQLKETNEDYLKCLFCFLSLSGIKINVSEAICRIEFSLRHIQSDTILDRIETADFIFLKVKPLRAKFLAKKPWPKRIKQKIMGHISKIKSLETRT
eukprot:gb/GECH01007448.1/.p1 GENE.gb/GECH01007448.1/~~gb/GECH01007448.1/.p1  ORF type:complete len:199 (+),score=20.54 gb/GECH01007448.1/:1-597(+)